jgi:hypothetical protein
MKWLVSVSGPSSIISTQIRHAAPQLGDFILIEPLLPIPRRVKRGTVSLNHKHWHRNSVGLLWMRQHSQQTDIHSLGGIRTRNPSKRVPQTLVLDRSAIGKGVRSYTSTNFWHQQLPYLSVFPSPVSGKCILQTSLLLLPSTCTK